MKMDIATIKTALNAMGWIEDRFGNFKSVSGKVRVNIKKTAVRIEREYIPEPTTYDPKPAKQWINIVSDYVKNVTIVDGKVCVKGNVLKVQ